MLVPRTKYRHGFAYARDGKPDTGLTRQLCTRYIPVAPALHSAGTASAPCLVTLLRSDVRKLARQSKINQMIPVRHRHMMYITVYDTSCLSHAWFVPPSVAGGVTLFPTTAADREFFGYRQTHYPHRKTVQLYVSRHQKDQCSRRDRGLPARWDQ